MNCSIVKLSLFLTLIQISRLTQQNQSVDGSKWFQSNENVVDICPLFACILSFVQDDDQTQALYTVSTGVSSRLMDFVCVCGEKNRLFYL